jgi:hypothetical protein
MHDIYHGGCRRHASIARLFVNSFQLSPTRLLLPNLGANVTQNIYPWLYNVSLCHKILPMACG